MNSISVSSYSAWVNVETDHGSSLEFVLSAAAERKSLTLSPDYYSKSLFDSICEALEPLNYAWFDSHQTYGDISYKISANTLEALHEAINISAKVVNTWSKRYNVNKMKVD
jgi:hypothetical protein